MSDLKVQETVIPGFYEIDLVVNSDNRGSFKENYQQEKLEALGLPHFEIKQNNVAFNKLRGVTRGLHAEPWEKYISVASGQVFGAWVDLRQGPTFGKTFTLLITPEKAVFVPRGIANAYQTLEDNTVYTYLVNDFWSADKKYQALNAFDSALKIDWPIAKDQALVSDKDLNNPLLSEVSPMEF